MPQQKSKQPFSIESQLALLTLFAGAIPSLALLMCLWLFDVSLYLLAIIAILLLFLIAYCVFMVKQKAQHQFQILHNLLDYIARGDYSIRASSPRNSGAFGELVTTINTLANTLQKQRLQSQESQLLLQKVVDQIDVAIIAWDQLNKVRLINPAAKNLLNLTADKEGLALSDEAHNLPQVLAFTNQMQVGSTQVRDIEFDRHRGKYRLHMERFIAAGDTHNLLFITNISTILRVEERKAWRNLVRVLSHEINNSLTPLTSLSNTLKKQIQKREQDPELASELMDGMSIIGNRAESLAAFVRSYQKIARLPEPDKKSVNLAQIIEAICRLFPNENIQVKGEAIALTIDASQFEQVIINLIKNSVEAIHSYQTASGKASALEQGAIVVQWQQESSLLVLKISDNGVGVKNSENLFTPFYTTKPTGSGIGLVFCQQVIEAHGGFISISNAAQQHGCVVSIELPLH